MRETIFFSVFKWEESERVNCTHLFAFIITRRQ